MSFAEISIEHHLPVINGFVVIPGEEFISRYKLTPERVSGEDGSVPIIDGSSTFRVGQKPVDDKRLKLPSFDLEDGTIYPEDWHQQLRDA